MNRLVLVVISLFAMSCGGGSVENKDAKTIAQLIQSVLEGKAVCEAKQASKTILCIVNASDVEADKLVTGIVHLTNAQDVPITGWKLTLVTPNDYVVSRRF